MKKFAKVLWATPLIAVFVAFGATILWAGELPLRDRRCPSVEGKEYAGSNVPKSDAELIIGFTHFNEFRCKRVSWLLKFEDHYGGVFHFECDGKWTYRWPADRTGLRPISRAIACYTGL